MLFPLPFTASKLENGHLKPKSKVTEVIWRSLLMPAPVLAPRNLENGNCCIKASPFQLRLLMAKSLRTIPLPHSLPVHLTPVPMLITWRIRGVGSWEIIISFLISPKGRKEVENIWILATVVLRWMIVVNKDYYCCVSYIPFRIIHQVDDILEQKLETPSPVIFNGPCSFQYLVLYLLNK